MANGPQFLQYDLKTVQRGSTVVVTLNKAANVRLMNSSNFRSFKNGQKHRYHGGLVKISPFRVVVPSTGHWHVTIDLMGLRATSVRSSVAVEPPPLPIARSARSQSLAGIRHEPSPALAVDDGRIWDVFVSHASEDKDAVARPLAEALRALGVEVWLDENELRIGDSLRRKIDQGLARSSFGVVIFSKSFFAKGWPQYELDGIVSLSVSGKQRMLPIWHEISKDEVARQAPSLVDKIARSTSIHTVEEIASEIAGVIHPDKDEA